MHYLALGAPPHTTLNKHEEETMSRPLSIGGCFNGDTESTQMLFSAQTSNREPTAMFDHSIYTCLNMGVYACAHTVLMCVGVHAV